MTWEEEIYENNNKRALNIIKGFAEVDNIRTSLNDFLEKGKKAVAGEIREWSGTKYRKLADGNWERVKNIKTQKFVDEDTGEEVDIEYDADERALNLEFAEMRNKNRNGNASKRRDDRKMDAKADKYAHKMYDAKDNLRGAEDDLKYLNQELKEIDSNMNHEAGEKGDDWTDDDANKYGNELMKKEAEIVTKTKEISELKKIYTDAKNRFDSHWNNR